MPRKKRPKHKFTPLNLSVSQNYLFPASRNKMVWTGSVIGLIFLSYFFFDVFSQRSDFISTGPVSSNHANFEKECSDCHDLGNSVLNSLCSSCHEKTSKLTIYDFKAHYFYRSNDFRRISQDSLRKYENQEMPCSSCHPEHNGRDATVVQVADLKCIDCHTYGSFNTNHPEFDFAQNKAPDDSTLFMTHLRHTVFVLQKIKGIENLDILFKTLKAETMDFSFFFEQACLYCHNPEADGKNFENINFAQHCAQCHIKSDAVVAGLPKVNPGNPNKAGVETIQQMQLRGGPGILWTFATNTNLVIDEDSEVSKSPILHNDPWIMENLKQIRKKLYHGAGLFDLLETFGRVSIQRLDTLYSEAIRTLQSYSNELQNHSELKGELSKINLLLKTARQKLEVPSPKRSKSQFTFPFKIPHKKLSENQRADFQQLVFDLTAADGPECRKCHVVENAGIGRVQTDQDVLIRAEFNHRAHILEKRCTECHTEIPFEEKLLKFSVENYSEFKQKFSKIFKKDRAATQNIPKLSTCQQCHSTGKVANDCVTCHKFHPNKKNRSNLLLFVEK